MDFEVKDLNAVNLFSMTKADRNPNPYKPNPAGRADGSEGGVSSRLGRRTPKKLPKPTQGEIQKQSMELIKGLRTLASPDATAMAEKATAMAIKRDRGASSSGSSSAAPKATANAKKRKVDAAAGEAEAAASSKKKGKRKA